MKFDFVRIDTSIYEKINDGSIEMAEKEMGFKFPKELVDFYNEVGCGFVGGSGMNNNRLMGPISVCDFRLRQYDYEFYPDINAYDEYEENKLIFFEQNLSSLISIGIEGNAESKIYYYDIEIASSLKEFLEKMIEDETYFSDDVIKELDERVRKSKEKSI